MYTRWAKIPRCLPILFVHLPGQRSVLKVPGNRRGQCAYKQNQQIPLVHLYLLSRKAKCSSCIKRKSTNYHKIRKVNSQLLSMLELGFHFISKSLRKQVGEWSVFVLVCFNHLTPEFYQLGENDKTCFLCNWIWIFDCSLDNSNQYPFYILCTWRETKTWV